jgi:hypothetical protein
MKRLAVSSGFLGQGLQRPHAPLLHVDAKQILRARARMNEGWLDAYS